MNISKPLPDIFLGGSSIRRGLHFFQQQQSKLVKVVIFGGLIWVQDPAGMPWYHGRSIGSMSGSWTQPHHPSLSTTTTVHPVSPLFIIPIAIGTIDPSTSFPTTTMTINKPTIHRCPPRCWIITHSQWLASANDGFQHNCISNYQRLRNNYQLLLTIKNHEPQVG